MTRLEPTETIQDWGLLPSKEESEINFNNDDSDKD